MKNTKLSKNLKTGISILSPADILFAKQSSRFARTVCNLSKLAQELLLMAIGTIYTFPSKKKFSVEFKVSDFLKAFHKDNVSRTDMNKLIFNAVIDELAKVLCYEDIEKYFEEGEENYRGKSFPLFSFTEIDTKKNIKLTFNEYALNNIQEIKPYEIIEFEKAAKIKSKHAFNIYKYALSKQGFAGKNGNKAKSWWFELEVNQLKMFLGVAKEDYPKMQDFQKRCLKEPIEELNSKDLGININWSSIKNGKKIIGFHFDCKETSSKLKIEKADSFDQKQEKQEINEDWAKESLWEKMQSAFPEIWQKYFLEEKSKGVFVFDQVAKNAVYERMISEGFKI